MAPRACAIFGPLSRGLSLGGDLCLGGVFGMDGSGEPALVRSDGTMLMPQCSCGGPSARRAGWLGALPGKTAAALLVNRETAKASYKQLQAHLYDVHVLVLAQPRTHCNSLPDDAARAVTVTLHGHASSIANPSTSSTDTAAFSASPDTLRSYTGPPVHDSLVRELLPVRICFFESTRCRPSASS